MRRWAWAARRGAARAAVVPRFPQAPVFPPLFRGPFSGLGQGQVSLASASKPQQQASWAATWAIPGVQSPSPLPRSSATARMARRIDLKETSEGNKYRADPPVATGSLMGITEAGGSLSIGAVFDARIKGWMTLRRPRW